MADLTRHTARAAAWGALLFTIIHSVAFAQMTFSGEAAVHFLRTGRSGSPRVVNQGRPTFAWRADFFADAVIAENISFISNIRVFQNEDPTFDFLAVRITDVTPLHLNFQIGKFDVPFGNLGERRFASRNPLYSLPLMYEFGLNLPSRAVTVQEMRSTRGRGAGFRALDFGIYDIGAMVYGGTGILGYALALTNGTVSAPSNRLQNTNMDIGKLARVTVAPLTGVLIGAAYSTGDYLSASTASAGNTDYLQHTAEVDVEYSSGHVVFFGQGLYSSWETQIAESREPVEMYGWYAEARWNFQPRWYVAVRGNGLIFSEEELLSVEGWKEKWDYDQFELEGGLGYAVNPVVLLKGVYRYAFTKGISDPADNLVAMQIVARF